MFTSREVNFHTQTKRGKKKSFSERLRDMFVLDLGHVLHVNYLYHIQHTEHKFLLKA